MEDWKKNSAIKPNRKAWNRRVPEGAEEEILRLYEQGTPIKEIAKKYAVTHEAIYEYIPAKKRDRLGGYPKGWTEEKIGDVSSMSELEKMGLILYASEGCKWAWRVDLANSNPCLGRLHIRWLSECYGIDPNEIKVRLTVHDDRDIEKCLSFWSRELGIPLQQFMKPDIREGRKKPQKLLYNGSVNIRLNNAKLFRLIMARLRALLDSVASNPKVLGS